MSCLSVFVAFSFVLVSSPGLGLILHGGAYGWRWNSWMAVPPLVLRPCFYTTCCSQLLCLCASFCLVRVADCQFFAGLPGQSPCRASRNTKTTCQRLVSAVPLQAILGTRSRAAG